MSLFNMAVRPHPFSPVLLRSINWAQPDDPNKKYPELGRMRYVWMTEDFKQVKILLKDGPGSWTDEEHQDAMMDQIRGHEGFVDVKVCERGNEYLEATFNPIADAGYDRMIDLDDLENIMREADEDFTVSMSGPSITASPWDLFDKAMEDMSAGKTTPAMDNFKKSLEMVVENFDAERQIDQMASENGIETKGEGVRVFGVDSDGNIKNPGQP